MMMGFWAHPLFRSTLPPAAGAEAAAVAAAAASFFAAAAFLPPAVRPAIAPRMPPVFVALGAGAGADTGAGAAAFAAGTLDAALVGALGSGFFVTDGCRITVVPALESLAELPRVVLRTGSSASASTVNVADATVGSVSAIVVAFICRDAGRVVFV